MLLLCSDIAAQIGEFDKVQNALRGYVSRGHMITVEDIVDHIKAETGNEIPASCNWLVVQLAVAMLRLVMSSPR